jgi:hypothetical protein
MKTIVHKIRLKEGATSEEFERWVREMDYGACPDLPSISFFGVHAVTNPAEAGYHYFEVIGIESQNAFDADMKLPAFGSLVARFTQMAEVVDEIQGELIEPGYRYGVKTDAH